MRLVKSLILSFIAIIICSSYLVFCEDFPDLTPSGDVVGISFKLKYPYVQQKLNTNAKTLQIEDIILSIKYNNRSKGPSNTSNLTGIAIKTPLIL